MAYITFMVWHCFKTRKHTLVIRFFSFTLIPFSFIFSLSFSIRIRVLHFHFSFRFCVKVCVPHTILFSILSRRSFPLRRIKQLKKFWLFFRIFFGCLFAKQDSQLELPKVNYRSSHLFPRSKENIAYIFFHLEAPKNENAFL